MKPKVVPGLRKDMLHIRVFCISLSTLLCCNVLSFSESYEGWIERFPVWFDLSLPQKDGPVKGNYFYKKVGVAITLKGEKKGRKVILTEFGKNGTPTGYFDCSLSEDSFVGNWGKKSGENLYSVKMTRTDSSYRPCAKNQAKCEKLIRDGMVYDTDIHVEPPTFACLYSRKNIFCASTNWHSMGAYENFGTDYYLYDLRTMNQIEVWDEIDSAAKKDFYHYLAPDIQTFLSELHASQTDSVWRDNFGTFHLNEPVSDTAAALEKIFSIPPTLDHIRNKIPVCYIEGESVHFENSDHGYLGFPHVNQALDMMYHIEIPFEDFIPFLKQSSPLRGLAH